MKKLISNIVAGLCCFYLNAQQAFTNNGNFQIHTGASITGFGAFTNTSGSAMVNNGNFYVAGNITNDQSSMAAGTGTLYLNGSSAQSVNGSQGLKTYDFVSNNTAGITLNNNLCVNGAHTFTNGLISSSVTPNYLIYEAGSSYTGSGDSKHVNGWVKKNGNTNFIFPVGNSTYERPVALESLSASSEFNVKYNAPTPFQTQLLLPIKSVMGGEYWTINKISGGAASVHLNWDNSKVPIPAFNIIDIVASYYNINSWTDEGGTATGNITTTGDVTSNSVSAFGNFVVASKSYPLPLTFLSFTGQRKDNFSDLKWITADEINTDHFEIERSDNGSNFSSISTMTALNNASVNEYTYKDYKPINRIVFYRIRCVDIDGKSKLSKVVALYESSSLTKDIRVLNPASGDIIIRSRIDDKQPTSFMLMDETGKLITKGTLKIQAGIDNLIHLPASLSRGIYFLRLSGYDKEYFQRVLIQ